MVYTETVELWVIINGKHQFSSSLFCIIRSLIFVFLPSRPRSGQLCREPPQASFLRGLRRGSREPGIAGVPGPYRAARWGAPGGLPPLLQPWAEGAGRPHRNRSFLGGASRRGQTNKRPAAPREATGVAPLPWAPRQVCGDAQHNRDREPAGLGPRSRGAARSPQPCPLFPPPPFQSEGSSRVSMGLPTGERWP